MKKYINGCTYCEEIINGLKTVMLKQTKDDNFLLSLYLPYGSTMYDYLIDDIRVKSGAAHFIEHRLFDSINGDVDYLCSKLGLINNAETSASYTLYYIYGPKKNFKFALKILFDMFFNIKRDEKKLKIEKDIIIAESKETYNNYIDVFERKVDKTLFKDTFFEYQVIGSTNDIKSMTYDDLIRYHEAFYDKNNATLIALGNFSFNELIDFINSYAFVKKQKHDVKYAPIPLRQKKHNLIKYANVLKSVYCYAFNVSNRIKEKHGKMIVRYFDFLDDILTSSNLIEKLKLEKIITNDISLNYVCNDDVLCIYFLGLEEKNMKKVIVEDILKQIKSNVLQNDLIAYQKSLIYDNLFYFDDLMRLNDSIVSILENRGNVYKEIIKPIDFCIDEFYEFIDDIMNNSVCSHMRLIRKEF